MSPVPLNTLTRMHHDPLSDKARSLKDAGGSLPDFEYIHRANDTWTRGRISLQGLCNEQEPPSAILLVFLPKEHDLIDVGAHEVLSTRFNIAASFWTELALEASGFFGSQEDRSGDEKMTGYSSQFRFLVKQPEKKQPTFQNIGIQYYWQRLGFSIYWKPLNSVILCFDLPTSLKDLLMTALPTSSGKLHLDDPFSLHSVLVGQVVELYNTSVWSWRDVIRGIEKNRTSKENPQPDYVLMHEMARHAIHSSEMLAMAMETLASIIREQDAFSAESSTRALSCRQTGKDLRYMSTLFKCLHLRSKALEERLRNEINLAFNVVTQYDSGIAVRIADATQVDSASMKTIATLGLVFLPGTFICAIFSTTFFNFSPGSDSQPQSWTISDRFWIYWVVAIPVTGATILLWSIWQRWQSSRSILRQPA